MPRVRGEVPHRFFCCLLSFSILIRMRKATMNPTMGMSMKT